MTPPTLLKWRNFMRDCPSPDIWVDLGWYFAVAAALQRRVWYNDIRFKPTFVNMYIVFIGPPGCGKGNVLEQVVKFFKHPQMRKNSQDRDRDPRKGEQMPLKVALGPSDATYQAIMDEMAASTAVHRYTENGRQSAYIHSSMAIILDEMNSMFKRHSNEVANFLLKTFDCADHDYKTRHSQSNILTKTCVNLLAGCTNTMLVDAARFGIFEDGFVSRCIFSFEFAPKFYAFDFQTTFDEGQQKDHKDLLDHLDRLTGMFGQLSFSQDALDYFRDQFNTVDVPNIQKARSKMQTYYTRKAIHLKKLAAAVHFARDFSMTVGLEDAMEARRVLDIVEPKMAAGFNSIGRNENFALYKEISRRIATSSNGASLAELLIEFHSECTLTELQEIISMLVLTCEVTQKGDRYYGK